MAEPSSASAAAAASKGHPEKVWRIALAQISPVLGHPERNLALHRARIEAARQAAADLVVFPELSLAGYSIRDMVPDLALGRDAAEIGELAEAAGGMGLVAGFVEESAENRFYNAAFYAEGGRVLHVHRKVFLPTYGLFDEQRYFAAGDRLQAFTSPRFGRVGLLICEDFWHLSAMAVMQAEDVDLLICIANSPARGVETPRLRIEQTYEQLATAYAQLLGAVVVFVNRTGFEDGLCFWGGSMVVSPSGTMWGQAPLLDEELGLVDFAPAILRHNRIVTPIAKDEQLLLTIEELQRIRRRRYES